MAAIYYIFCINNRKSVFSQRILTRQNLINFSTFCPKASSSAAYSCIAVFAKVSSGRASSAKARKFPLKVADTAGMHQPRDVYPGARKFSSPSEHTLIYLAPRREAIF